MGTRSKRIISRILVSILVVSTLFQDINTIKVNAVEVPQSEVCEVHTFVDGVCTECGATEPNGATDPTDPVEPGDGDGSGAITYIYESNLDGTHEKIAIENGIEGAAQTEDCTYDEDEVCIHCGYSEAGLANGLGDMGISPLSDGDGDDIGALYLNDSIVSIAHTGNAAIDWDNMFSLPYNSDMSFQVKAGDTSESIKHLFYLTTVSYDGNKDIIIDQDKALIKNGTDQGVCLPVGNYYLFFQAEHSASLGVHPDGSDDYGYPEYAVKVVPATLKSPENLTWDASTEGKYIAKWDAVSKDNSSKDITAGTKIKYQLKLYYEDESEPIYTSYYLTDGDTSIDVYSYVTASEGKGYGKYHFEVVAYEDTTGTENYSESSIAKSDDYEYRDDSKPTISKYTVEGSGKDRALTATASDTGSGVAAYAFVAAGTTVDADYTGWTSVSKEDIAADIDYTAKIELKDVEPGHIYFYVKDKFDNIECQMVGKSDPADSYNDQGIYLTRLKLNNYYNSSKVKVDDYTIDLVNDESVTLPVEGSESGQMGRTGYSFNGWYTKSNPADTDEPYTRVTPGSTANISKGATNNLYAKWSRQNIQFRIQPTGTTKVYDGENYELKATLESTVSYDTISWQWYQYVDEENDTLVDEAKVSSDGRTTTLSLKDVADSGSYYAKATIKVEGEDDEFPTSEKADVNITKRNLRIKIADQEIYFGQTASDFSFEVDTNAEGEGFVGDDTIALFDENKADLTAATYTAGVSGVGTYDITYSKASDTLSKDNYNVILNSPGTLTVSKKSLAEADVVIELGKTDAEGTKTEYSYDGTAHTPNVISVKLKNSDGTLTDLELTRDYTVSYRENINADKEDTAVLINFQNNFDGTVAAPFTIIKGTYDINTTVTNWKYGEYSDAINKPGLDTLKGGTATYYYLPIAPDSSNVDAYGNNIYTYASYEELITAFDGVDRSGKTVFKSENADSIHAGKYYVWAEITATDNYAVMTSKPAILTVSRRNITIESASYNKPYDGNSHVGIYEDGSAYKIIGESEHAFHGEDDFKTVSVTGSIKDIGTITSTISYEFTSATHKDDYQITLIPGTLTVTHTQLVPPSSFGWKNGDPGTLSWIAITRDNLAIEYKLTLYRTKLDASGNVLTNEGGIEYEQVGEPVTTSETSYSFLDTILADSATTQYGYSATIQVLPKYGLGEKENYIASVVSSKIAPKYTAKVSIDRAAGTDGDGVDNYRFETMSGTQLESPVVMLQGQSIRAKYSTKYGYMYARWNVTNNEDGGINRLTASNGKYHEYEDGEKYDYSSTFTFTNNTLTKPANDIIIYAKSKDDNPWVSAQNVTLSDDLETAYISMTLKDRVGLEAYGLTKLSAPVAEGEAPTDPTEWIPIPKDSEGKALHTYDTGNISITEDGCYYLFVKDTSGNITYSEEPIILYSITFRPGDESVTGTMNKILKIKDNAVHLPELAYERAGYGFTNWTGTSGIYSKDGIYVANKSDTLVAGWTDAKVTYTVRYFYETLATETDEESGQTVYKKPVSYVEAEPVKFSVAYGTTVNYDNSSIQALKTGYELDASPCEGYVNSITCQNDGQDEISIYYKLKQYNIKYTYIDSDKSSKDYTDTYYYGETVKEHDKPSKVGYRFIGWNWGDAGAAPTTMPNNNLTVTGRFQSEATQYYIVYYEQNLDQSVSAKGANYLAKSFEKIDSLTETINANYADNLMATLTKPESVPDDTTSVVARDIIGFTPKAVKIYYGAPATTTNDDEFDSMIDGTKTSDNGTVQKYLTGDELTAAGEEYKNGPTYICFYYTRNTYSLSLDVYKDARENGGYLFGSYFDGTSKEKNPDSEDDNARWTFPYGYQFLDEASENSGDGSSDSFKASYFETYGHGTSESEMETVNNKKYSRNWTKRWPTGADVASKDKYYLADFIDWSTGSRPETMPAGDVTITREYASAEQSKFVIDVYTEQVETVPVTINGKEVNTIQALGKYKATPDTTFEMFDEVGRNIKIVDTMPSEEAKEPNTTYVLVSGLIGGVDYAVQYEHNPANDRAGIDDKERLTGAVTENVRHPEPGAPDGVMHLRVNLVRKEYTAYVRYYKSYGADKGRGEGYKTYNDLFAYTEVKAKWGTTYFVDPLCYFDGATAAPTYTAPSYDENDVSTATKTATVEDSSIIISGTENFRNKNYTVSYAAYRYIVEQDTHTNPSGKYNNISGGVKTDYSYLSQNNIHNADVQMWVMGATKEGTDSYATWGTNHSTNIYNYVNVYYAEQKLEEHYTLSLYYEDHNNGHTIGQAVNPPKALVPSVASVDSAKDASGNPLSSTVDISSFQIRVANACDVFESTLSSDIPEGWSYYPGGYYAYDGEDKAHPNYTHTDTLKSGFEKITMTYGGEEIYEHKDDNPDTTATKIEPREGTFYLLKVNGSYDGYIYAIDARDQFYSGNRISYSYQSSVSARVGRDVFAAADNRPTATRVYERNNSTGALHLNGKAVELNSGNMPSNGFLAYYYDCYDDKLTITYRYNGVNCTACASHTQYNYGDDVTEFRCTHFTAPTGYQIVWYKDQGYTEPVEPFKITKNVTVYGNKEKLPVENWDYAFYKLPQKEHDIEAGTTDWVTDQNVNSIGPWVDRTVYYNDGLLPNKDIASNINNTASTAALNGTGFEKVTLGVDVPYNGKTLKGVQTSWYYNGLLVMTKTSDYSETFSEFHMDYTRYNKPGFTYDETNVKNKSKAFCTTTPVTMYAYFTRDIHTLTVARNRNALDNDEVSNRVSGSKVTLEDITKEGYTFQGWKLQKVTETEGAYSYTDLNRDDYGYQHTTGVKTVFRMPICDTRALAIWEPAAIDFKIINLMQDDTQTYNVDAVSTADEIISKGTHSSVSATIDGDSKTVEKCEADGQIVAYVAKDGNYIYYYAGKDFGASDIVLESSDLMAVVESVSGIKSEDVISLSSHKLNSTVTGAIFEYSFSSYQENAEAHAENQTGTENVKAYFDTEIINYYARSSSLQVRVIDLPSDNSDHSGLTLSGAGTYFYGQHISLYATCQPKGYDFKGWYKAEDVLEGYPTDGTKPDSLTAYSSTNPSGYKIKDDISGARPVSPLTTYPISVRENIDLVAITEVNDITLPTVKVTSTRILTTEEASAAGKPASAAKPYYYGYEADTSNVLVAGVNWGESGAGASAIAGYKWYYKYYDESTMSDSDIADLKSMDLSGIATSDMTEIEKSNSGTYLFPTGKDAGYYVYRCVLDVENKDNGRTKQVEGSYLLEVHPSENYYKTTDVEANYAGTNPGYTFTEDCSVKSLLDIYYSETAISKDITADELSRRLALSSDAPEHISTTKPSYKDVKVNAEADGRPVIPHTVYICCKSKNKNYADIATEANVKINPINLTVSATSKAFTKIYDGSNKAQGSYGSYRPDGLSYVGGVYSSNPETYSDFHRLQTGSDGNQYYRIDGILAVDQNLTLYMDFDATFDSPHVDNVTKVTLSNLWVVQKEIDRVVNNYNYRFPKETTIDLSAQIKPYPLSVKWIPYEDSVHSVEYGDSDFEYRYTGYEQAPCLYITDDKYPDKGTASFEIAIRNKNKSVGTYEATAEVIAGEGAPYRPSDYTFSLTGRSYTIKSRFIKVVPKDVTKVYNGSNQTMIKSDILDEFTFYSKTTPEGAWEEITGLPAGETFSVTADKSYTNVGQYAIKAQGLKVISGGKNINDNYDITYGEGTLTIAPCPVIVEGITAENKDYDGNTSASTVVTGATFKILETNPDGSIKMSGDAPVVGSGLYGSDALGIDGTKVTGTFDTPQAGNGKTVTLTIDNSSALTDGSKGALTGDEVTRANYKLETAYSQKTTTANITAGTKLTAHVKDMEYTYGESVSYSDYEIEYTGLISPDTASVVNGDLNATFIIKSKNADGTYTEVISDGTSAAMASLDAGEYYIFLKEKTSGTVEHEVDGLRAANYTIVASATPAKLTVKPRPIGLARAEADPAVTKDYDGTKSVPANVIKTKEDGNFKYYKFTEVDGEAVSGLVNGDDVAIDTYNAVYNAATVEGANEVHVTNVVLGGTKANNYTLCNDAFDVKGRITPISLTVRVNSAQTIYGNAMPEITYVVTGALSDEKATIENAVKALKGVICEYDISNASKRDAGDYKLIASTKYTNPNYEVTYEDGNTDGSKAAGYGWLTVNKRVVYYSGSDVTINYGRENPPSAFAGEFVDDSNDANDYWVYGEALGTAMDEGNTARNRISVAPEGSTSVDIFSNAELSDSISLPYTVTYDCFETGTISVGPKTPHGDYAITPKNVENHIYAKNYEFKVKDGNLHIRKYYLIVENVEVLGKIYDGTTTVDSEHLLIKSKTVSGYTYPGLTFTYYEGESEIANKSEGDLRSQYGDDYVNSLLESLKIEASYKSSVVSSDAGVNVKISIVPGSYLDGRYILLTDENKAEAHEQNPSHIAADTTHVTQTETRAFIVGAGGKTYTAILPRNLLLYPSDKTIKYGTELTVGIDAAKELEANYSLVKDEKPAKGATGDDRYKGFVAGESFSNIPGFSLNSQIYGTALDGDDRPTGDPRATYEVGSDVGNYAIDISASAPETGIHGNYNISFAKGLMVVVQNQFPAPEVTWSSNAGEAGTITWTEVSKIGNVDVDHYELQLYKGESPVGSVINVPATSDRKYDFLSAMHDAGEGEYTVKIRAVASTTNNDTYKNVKENGEEGTSPSKYAAKVTVVFDTTTDSDTVKAVTGSQTNTINGAASYVMVAGESGIPVAYSWSRLNPTDSQNYSSGYSIDKITSSSTKLILGTGSDVTDNSATGSYANKVSLASDTASASDITVTLYLKARAADLTATVVETHDPAKTSVMYGYGSEGRPVYSVNNTHLDSTDYTYTYEWSFKKGFDEYKNSNMPTETLPGGGTSSIIWNEQTFNFPYGQKVFNNNYVISCKVIATRKDNGQSITNTPTINLKINKFVPGPDSITLTVTDSGWKYGETRTGKIRATKQFDDMGDIILQYRKKGEGDSAWKNASSFEPSDAGEWQVRAELRANDNYDGTYSAVKDYTISSNKLATPEGLTMGPTVGKAPYGTVRWTAVEGPKENAGAAGSKSSIDVYYELELSRTVTVAGVDHTDVLTTVKTKDTSYDFTDYIDEAGAYKVKITAKVANGLNADLTGTVDSVAKNNCADSDPTSVTAVISIGAKISVSGADSVTSISATKEYTGSPVHLEAEYEIEEDGVVVTTYQWMKNGDDITGATNRALDIRYVEENATYACRIMPRGAASPAEDMIYSTTMKVTITPRPITIMSAKSDKDYDGTPLSLDKWWIKENVTGETPKDSFGNPTEGTANSSGTVADNGSIYLNTVANVSVTGTITTQGTENNTINISGLTINEPADGTKAAKQVYSASMVEAGTANYVINKTEGQLKVGKKSLGDSTGYAAEISVSQPVSEEYNARIHEPAITVTDSSRTSDSQTLLKGTDYTTTYTNNINAGTATITITGINNYSGVITRTFQITERPVTITWSTPVSFTFDGSEHGVTATLGNLATNVSGEIDNVTVGSYVSDAANNKLNKNVAAGNYEAAVATLAGAKANNYTLEGVATNACSWSIAKPQIAATVTGYDQAYDTLSHGISITNIKTDTGASLVNNSGQAYVPTIYYSTESVVNAGNYSQAGTAAPTFTDAGTYTVYYYIDGGDNYLGLAGSDTVKISKVDQTISASNLEVTYDGQNHELAGATVRGVGVAGDTANVGAITYENNGRIDAGTTTVTIKAAATTNYNEASITKTIKINPLPVVLSWDYDEFEYDGTAKTVLATVTNPVTRTGESTADNITVKTYASDVANKIQNVATSYGTYTATATELISLLSGIEANYTLTGASNVSHIWKINKTTDPISNIQDLSKVYDGTSVSATPTFTHNVANTGTVTYEFFKRVGATYVKLDSAPKDAGEWYVRITIAETENYKKSVSEYQAFTISKRAIVFKSDSDEKIYDGTPLTKHSYTVAKKEGATYDGTPIASTDAVDVDAITYTGTITNVKYTGGVVDSVENTYSTASSLIKCGDAIVTANYDIAFESGSLKVTPRNLVTDDLTLTPLENIYTGSLVGPTISVDVDLTSVGGTSRTTKLTEGSDYAIANDSATKVSKATNVGTYTIEVTGKGNYQGTISKTYSIKDTTAPVIGGKSSYDTDVVTGGKYCKTVHLKITDQTLKTIVIEGTDSTGTSTIVNEDFGTDAPYTTEYTYDLPGSDEGTVYNITATDVSGNSKNISITVYKDHSFTIYNDDGVDPGHNHGQDKADCDHGCGQVDYAMRFWGEVKWNYHFSYTVSTDSEEHEGDQGVDERATVARVELHRNGEVIATRYVDCDNICGPTASAPIPSNTDGRKIPFSFDKYNRDDPQAVADSCTDLLLKNNPEGHPYLYSITVTPVTHEDSIHPADDFEVIPTKSYTSRDDVGDVFSIIYDPNCFNVPWKVTLKGVPEAVAPETIYVKVLYATKADAIDSEYNIISQQATGTGYACTKIDNGDGTYYYEGHYPVWEYIAGTTDSYYHRIQVVGYDGYDVTSQNLRSICDSDHVNHTIYYTGSGPSGTILYELVGLSIAGVPLVVFDGNGGEITSDEDHILLNHSGDELTEDAVASITVARPGHSFLGWYDSPTGGNKITGIASVTNSVTLYAHWQLNVSPGNGGAPSAEPEPSKGPDADESPAPNNGGDGDPEDGEEEGGLPIPVNPGKQPTPGKLTTPAGLASPGGIPTPTSIKPIGPKGGTSPAPKNTPTKNTPIASATGGTSDNKEKPTSTKEASDDLDKLGNLEVFAEHVPHETPGAGDKSPDGGDKSPDGGIKSPGGDTKPPAADLDVVINADFADKKKVAEILLTDEEKKLLEDGGSIAIRLLVDDKDKQEPTEEADPELAALKRMIKSEIASEGQKVVFKSFVDLRLEKSIDSAEWERILDSGKAIDVVIAVPAGAVLGARRLVMARRVGSEYVILEDLDDDPYTITISTNDFDSDYVILAIEDEEEDIVVLTSECYWHWLIILTVLVWLVLILLTLRKKDDDESASENADSSNDEEAAKKSRNRRYLGLLPYAVLLVIFSIAGDCKWEIPCDLVGTILVLVTDYWTWKRRFSDSSNDKK